MVIVLDEKCHNGDKHMKRYSYYGRDSLAMHPWVLSTDANYGRQVFDINNVVLVHVFNRGSVMLCYAPFIAYPEAHLASSFPPLTQQRTNGVAVTSTG